MSADNIDKKGDLLNAIMNSAIKNFADKGFEGARVDEIAKDAGVNKATIYYHIGGKEALYKSVLTEVLTTGAAHVLEVVSKADTPEKKVEAYINAILNQVLGGREDFSRIMMREMAGGGANIPEDVLAVIHKNILGTMFSTISGGVNKEKLIPANPALVHMMIVGGFAFYTATKEFRRKLAPDLDKVDPKIAKEIQSDLAKQFTRILMDGLKVRIGDSKSDEVDDGQGELL